MRMQTGCRLVQDEDSLAGCLALQLACQLHALSLAARQSGCRLAKLDIVQADVMQCLKLGFDSVNRGEELNRFFHRHFQHIVNIFAFVGNLQRFFIVPLAMAFLTRNINIR